MAGFEQSRELLAELLRLDELDAQLPLPVLINLHRSQLRQPLEALVQLAGVVSDPDDMAQLANEIWRELRQRWPKLTGTLYAHDREVLDRYGMLARLIDEPDLLTVQQLAHEPRVEIAETLLGTFDGWHGHDPAAMLHRLTWQDAPVFELLAVLEAELATHPDVRRMLLELAHQAQEDAPC